MRVSGRIGSLGPACVVLLAFALSGCIEQAAELAPDPSTRPALVKREGMNLSEATVALVSVEGAPAAIAEKFNAALVAAAKAQEISLVDVGSARYLVRAYLSANATEDGAEVEYVWDVYGPDQRRAFRLGDALAVKGTGDDVWAIITPAALQSVAGKSASDLAAFLSRSPEARPVAQAGTSPALSYATAN